MKWWVRFVLLCSLFPPFSHAAGLSFHSVENQLEAAFFSKPSYLGELGQGDDRMRGFISNNGDGFVVCTAVYQVGRVVYRESDVREAVQNFITGQALTTGGVIVSQKIRKTQSGYQGTYLLTFNYQGMAVRKHAEAIYQDGRFYQWSVQDIPGVSKVDGQTLFNEYVKYFRVTSVESQNNQPQPTASRQAPSPEKSSREWIPVTSGPLGSVFIDLNSTKKIGKLYQVDTSVFYYDAQRMGPLIIKKNISTSQINCQDGTTSSISATVFSDEKTSGVMKTDKIFVKPTGPNTKSVIDLICDNKLPCSKTLKGDDYVRIIRLAGTTGYIVRNSKKGPSTIYGVYKEKPPCRESKQCDKVEDVVNRMVACGIKDSYVTNYLTTLERSWDLCDIKYHNKCRFLGSTFWP